MAEHALVTGGETGIGAAIGAALRADGFDVTTASRRSGCDLTDRASIEKLVGALDRLDLLVNNAGIAESAPLQKTTDEMWDRHLAINATAPFLLARAALPLLKESDNGRIINVGSTAGLSGAPYIAAYAASKHALLGLTRVLAAELKGIRVHCVCPGFVDTPLTGRSVDNIAKLTGMDAETARKSLAELNKSGRLITAGEVAEAVVDLARAEETGIERVLE